MTRTLILMRHAKSSWDDLRLSDHDRPLNKRGQRSAKALGNWLRTHSYVPDEALISSSARTVETFERLSVPCSAIPTRALYHAGPDQMLDVLHGASGVTVLMLGHNPGISEFASQIVSQQPDHDRFWDYPTGATLVVKFEIETWKEAAWRLGQTADFVIPRKLDSL